jgi:hypothetical protein
MESQGVPGRIQVTEEVQRRLRDRYVFEPRGPIEVKGKGTMTPYLLVAPAGEGVDASAIRATAEPR